MPVIGEIGTFAFGGRDEADRLVDSLRKAGWLACEGQSVDQRGSKGLPKLFDYIHTTWGTVDSANVFNLPDLRGQFLRGWTHNASIDADARGRGSLKENGASGNAVGSYQPDKVGEHNHSFPGLFPVAQNNGSNDWTPTDARATDKKFPAGSGETRPKNCYVMFCIFTGHVPVPAGIPFFGK